MHDKPIIALATPWGKSALALIRLSGAGVIDIVSRLFRGETEITTAAGNTIHFGYIIDCEHRERLDQVLLLLYRAPRSYTGEDSIEITCHGNPLLIKQIIALCVQAGCAEALPGEFTQRALYNGKIDLTQAEAVAEIIDAESSALRQQALSRLEGSVGTDIQRLKDELVSLTASVNIQLDYPQEESEEIVFDSPRLRRVVDELVDIAASYALSAFYSSGMRALICGQPNVGKSSLFNRLLGHARALISSEAGTTRDYLEGRIELCGVPIHLYDTAGLRDEGGEIEIAGIEKGMHLADRADILIYLVDARIGITYTDRAYIERVQRIAIGDSAHRAGIPQIIVYNKCDLLNQLPSDDDALYISAERGVGIDMFIRHIEQVVRTAVAERSHRPFQQDEHLGSAAVAESHTPTIISSERQRHLVTQAIEALRNALNTLDASLPLDMLTLDLEAAMQALGEITGEVTTADMLERMFSRFCVGK